MEKIKQLIQTLVDTSFAGGTYFAYYSVTGALYEKRREEMAKAKTQLIEQFEKLAKGLREVEALMGESEGVSGYHKNGNVAPWEEIRSSGRFNCLSEFDEALELLK